MIKPINTDCLSLHRPRRIDEEKAHSVLQVSRIPIEEPRGSERARCVLLSTTSVTSLSRASAASYLTALGTRWCDLFAKRNLSPFFSLGKWTNHRIRLSRMGELIYMYVSSHSTEIPPFEESGISDLVGSLYGSLLPYK